ncbi:ribonucleoside-diphosphate reductase,adenosylcobalamin-dependent (intein-containing) [Haloquadratum walsbyi DSM 16790]|jgi:ribonucleoside-diphosphate reductase alpha chain|uniref:Vitamin B12-dependent ribonucleotide reductase n=1 Tax=Haloquadratum walsbyi (strain DSM 16790 / HBSQ001) TaxID=362976 RepID=Q18GD3_HALWD|nr:adenosylcobalamin-dependent ribonucleoside-diphosphate reductase [Haloquadratum walsbyi]CAJ52966.1 ribonucleoside-diphosphate reductase,adenosylcobalamin-dependent (intein-containing) [Haloquadratum walsbyi DSM 16790]
MDTHDVDADELELPIKRTTGETIEQRLTDNAYHNILPARYLRKDAKGDLAESQEEIFERVAQNVALAEAVFEADKQDTEITVTPDQLKPDHPRRDELAEEVFGAGADAADTVTTTLSVYNVNKFAYETIVPELPDEVQHHVKSVADEFEDLMSRLSFMPNSPTLMNAGDELQQLSACFVDSPSDDISDIHQTAKEAAEVFQCLTADSTVMLKEKGMVSVSEVETGDQIAQRSDTGFQYKPVEETHAYENAETLTVTLTNGCSIRGTPNHRLMVDDEWTRIDEIQPDQEVHYTLGWLRETNQSPPKLHSQSHTTVNQTADSISPDSSEPIELSESENADTGNRHNSAVAVKQSRTQTQLISDEVVSRPEHTRRPDQLSEELAELLGLWIDTGLWHQSGVQFNVERENIAEYIDQLSQQLFDTPAAISDTDGTYTVDITDHKLKEWWKANFGGKPDGTQSSYVPQMIKEAPTNVIEAFLRGCFTAEGGLRKDMRPRLCTSSEDSIDDIAVLMMGLGYPVEKSVIRNADGEPYYSVMPATDDGLSAFLHDVGFIDERREIGLSNIESSDSRALNNTHKIEVESIVESPPATVYDITVADNHEYVTDGIISHNSGGGMGYAFWKLRPYGDSVGSTGGIASGPITFMRTYDQMCETIAQGGARRGAQMGVMRISHPDVIQFIHAKNKDVSLAHSLRLNDPDDFTHTSFADALEEARELIDEEGRVPEHLRNAVEGHLSNFNISVGVTDEFMEALFADEEFTFTNPRTEDPHIATPETKELYELHDLGEHVEVGEELSVPAEELWDHIVSGAHENGEPGVIYLERVNKEHSFDVEKHSEHEILATNPCGEQPLEEYEACNLGHINLSTLADKDAPDWRVWYDNNGDAYNNLDDAAEAFIYEAIDMNAFNRRIESGTRFLENVVTMSDFPVDEIEATVRDMRKIGLGIMGLAQLYIQIGVRYGSQEANAIAEQLMTHINHESKWASHELAKERGTFNDWTESKYANPTEYREWFEHHTGLDASEWEDGFLIRNHNTTTIAPTGCVEENSLVSTDEGLRPIKDLDNTTAEFEQWDEIDVGVTTDGGTKTATAVYDNGFANVRQIQTESGFNIAATPNHRFRTLSSDGTYTWKEAGKFESGDRVILQRNTFDAGSRVSLEANERADDAQDTTEGPELPGRMTSELAEFLGYFMGSGYISDETHASVDLVVDSDATELNSYLSNLGEQLFRITPAVESQEMSQVLSFRDCHLSRYFEDNGWKKTDTGHNGDASAAFVPEQILEGDEQVVNGFLRGVFEAIGTVSEKIEILTTSTTLADQLQSLLLSLGHVFTRDSTKLVETNNYHDDQLRQRLCGATRREDERFMNEIGSLIEPDELNLSTRADKNDTYPSSVIDHVQTLDGYDSVSESLKSRINQSQVDGTVSRKLIKDIEAETAETVSIADHELTGFYAATVESVTEDTAYTKDISVPSNNTYIADGFVTHNTTSMIGNTTGGCEPIYNVAYYKNVSDDVQGDEMLVEFDDYFLRVLEQNDIDVEAVKQEAQEQMANNDFDGVDGLDTVPKAIGELFVVTSDLSGKDHAGVQCACQEGIDSAISKTCNFPSSATKEDMDEVYRYIYQNGGKGVTVYRDGTRSKQVLTTRAQNTEFADESEAAETLVEQIEDVFGDVDSFLDNDTVRATVDDEIDRVLAAADGNVELGKKRPRPDVLHGVTQRIDTGYGKLYVNINEDDAGRPFELFANIGNSGGFTASFTEALAKTVSTALRSGVDPREIASELQGIRSPKVAWDKGEQINSIPDAVGTAMRRYLDGEIEKGYPQQQNLTEVGTDTGSEPRVESGSGSDAKAPGHETDGGAAVTDDTVSTNRNNGSLPSANDENNDTDDVDSLVAAGESPECPECGSMSLYYSEGCKTCESCGWSEC